MPLPVLSFTAVTILLSWRSSASSSVLQIALSRTAQVWPGDVLYVSSLTVHRGRPNRDPERTRFALREECDTS